jgi:hypothetical protein
MAELYNFITQLKKKVLNTEEEGPPSTATKADFSTDMAIHEHGYPYVTRPWNVKEFAPQNTFTEYQSPPSPRKKMVTLMGVKKHGQPFAQTRMAIREHGQPFNKPDKPRQELFTKMAIPEHGQPFNKPDKPRQELFTKMAIPEHGQPYYWQKGKKQ